MHRPATRHSLAVLRRHTFRSSDTTLVGSWLCCRKDFVHLSFLHGLSHSLSTLLWTSRKCVCVCRRLRESDVLPALAANPLLPAAASFVGHPRTCRRLPRSPSSSSHSFALSLLHRWNSSSYPFPPWEPCTGSRSAAAGFRLRHAPSTDLPAVPAYLSANHRARCGCCILRNA